MIERARFQAPSAIRLRPTTAGAILMPIELAGLVLSLVLGGPVALLTSAALTLLLLAPVAAWFHARRITLASPLPQERTVGEGFSLALPIRNASRSFAAAGLIVRALGTRTPHAAAHVPYLAQGTSKRVAVPYRMSDRGPLERLTVTVSSAFPFGLVRMTLLFELPVDMLGLPRIGRIEEPHLLPATARRRAAFSRSVRGGDDVLYSVRELRDGETPRRVHWKLSAKRGRTILSEFRSESDPPVRVLLSALVAPGSLAGSRRHRSFERAVGLAATLAAHYLSQGRAVRLELLGAETPSGLLQGRVGLRSGLYALALVQPIEDTDADRQAALREAVLSARAIGESVVGVFSSGRPLAVPEDPEVALFDVDRVETQRLFQAEPVST